MARLWSSGFELQSATSGVEWDRTTGTPTISTSTVRSGSASLRTNPTAAAAYVTHQYKTAGTSNNDYLRFYIRIATAPAGSAKAIALLRSTTSGNIVSLRINSNLTLELWNEQTAAQLGSDSSALSLNTWYRIELEYRRSASTGHAYIDGTQFATGTVANTFTTSDFRLGVIDSETCDYYFDDVAVNDSTGSVQTGLPGDGKIVYLIPTGSGDNNSWQPQGGGSGTTSNYLSVDEVTPDDATTYLKRISTPVKTDDYNVTDSSTAGIGGSDTVSLLQIGIRGGSTSASASVNRDVLLRLKSASGGTVTKSGTSTNRFNVNGWTTHTAAAPKVYTITSYTDPTTGIAWTPTGTNSLDNMQIGAETQVSTTTEVRFSTIWALVEYVPATGISVTPTTATLTTVTFGPSVTATANQTVTPGVSSLTTSTFAPTIAVSDNKVVVPGATNLTTSLFAPTVSVTANVNVTPGVASLSTSTFGPTVSATTNVTVTPSMVSLTTTAFAPTITAGGSASATPGVAPLTLTTFAPTVSATANVSVTPGTANLTTSGLAPSVVATANQFVTPSVASLTTSRFTPTVSTTANQFVTPSTASLTTSTFQIGVAVSSNSAITPSTTTLTLSTFAPSVTTSANQSVTPGATTLTVTSYAPIVFATDNKVVIPSTASVTLSTFNPTVNASNHISVTPAVANLILSMFAPTVATGANQTVTPGTATLRLKTQKPIVNGIIPYPDYYINTDGDVFWVVDQDARLVEQV